MTQKFLSTESEFIVKSLGVSDNELDIYRFLLQNDGVTVMQVSTSLNIPRATVHQNVKKLIKKGLIKEIVKNNRRKLHAEGPATLRSIFEREKLRLIEEQNKFQYLESMLPFAIKEIDDIAEISRKTNNLVQVFMGKEEVLKVYQDALTAKNVYSLVSLNQFYKVYPNTEDMFFSALDKYPDRNVYDIVDDSNLARKLGSLHPRYHVKYLPKDKFFLDVDFYVYDDVTAIINLDPENVVAFVFNLKAISKNFIALHKTIWSLA